MSESHIIERTPHATVIRTGSNGQRLTIPSALPILPIRNIVVFPGHRHAVERRPQQKSKNLLDEVMPGEKVIGVDHPAERRDRRPRSCNDLHPIGVACMILKLFKLPDGNQSIIVHGLTRFRLNDLTQTEPFAVGS